jgi:hypothetical protein
MQAIELPLETGRVVIAVLREKGIPYMLEHANVIEEQLERHGPDEPMVRLSLTDDEFLRSYNWARVQLGIPPPPERKGALGRLARWAHRLGRLRRQVD